MRRCSSKENKFRYIYTITGTQRDIANKKQEIYFIKIKINPYIIKLYFSRNFTITYRSSLKTVLSCQKNLLSAGYSLWTVCSKVNIIDIEQILQYRKAVFIRITCPCGLYPFTPHFYIIKLGFTGGIHYFLIFALKHILWVLVRAASMRRF